VTGEVTGIFCDGFDVTETHRATGALRELNAELERKVIERTQARGRVWQVTPDLMGALNPQGYFETSNPAWSTVLGWTEDEVAAMSIWELLHPDDLESTREGFALTQVGQPAIRFPNRYRRKDGTYRWISWVGVPDEGMVYCSGRDITEEKAAEAELAAAQDALRQSQKMEAVGQLTGGLAHDFNNLLAGITGSLEMLDKRLGEGRLSDVERYITAAQSSARRAAALTQRLLAFSRRQTLDPRPTDVNRLIAGMEDLVRRTVGPTVEVEVVGAGGLWLTRVDRSQLENALLNLCLNGRDAMEPGGGRLTIETANKWLDARAARDRELPPGQYVSLCVTDTGVGMAPEVINRVFDPFFTTKPLGQGTGLGLSMIYGFVRQSGGQVRIYSEVGKGTTMCLYLPRFAGAAEAMEDDLPPKAIEPGEGETVLVIDDEPTVRMLIVEVLEENGYAAIEAVDGAAGLKILQSDVRVDLLITDVGLPGGLNGRQVADAARQSRPDLKVLFITGYAENAVIGNGHLDAGMEVITKPFGMANLGAKIRSLIES
jgi:PAS domain S-box-containing protein